MHDIHTELHCFKVLQYKYNYTVHSRAEENISEMIESFVGNAVHMITGSIKVLAHLVLNT
jgi:hypothetical protein